MDVEMVVKNIHIPPLQKKKISLSSHCLALVLTFHPAN